MSFDTENGLKMAVFGAIFLKSFLYFYPSFFGMYQAISTNFLFEEGSVEFWVCQPPDGEQVVATVAANVGKSRATIIVCARR
jgi:hypothetical protein